MSPQLVRGPCDQLKAWIRDLFRDNYRPKSRSSTDDVNSSDFKELFFVHHILVE